jgi:hypothetical protein
MFIKDYRRTFALTALIAIISVAAAQAQNSQSASDGNTANGLGAQPTVTTENTAVAAATPNTQSPATQGVDKRVFGVLPNYRTANGSVPFEPISAKQKFTIATKDSFDKPVYLLTAAFAGLSQLQGSDNNIYGQGMKGFAHRYGIQYVDQVIGNYLPEAVIPTIFHTDPRYFRKGEGSFGSRLWYAVSRIAVCKNDRGNWTFNVNEFVGNSSAALLASSYHPQQRTLGDIGSQAITFTVSDTIGQVLKEFWPDVKKKLVKH